MVDNGVFCTDTASGEPTVTHVTPGGAAVSVMTSLDDVVFVARSDNSQQIDVYDTLTFTRQRSLSVPGLRIAYGLAACAGNGCLYASDFTNDSIHRVVLSWSNAVTTWPAGRGPAGLSVNVSKNVLVAIRDECKLQEFTTHGTLLRNIQLHSDIQGPTGVLELPSGQVVVSHIGTRHRVCFLDVSGAVVRSYGGTPDSEPTRMKWPAGLAVDKHGNILVADGYNNRLLVLDGSATSAREMTVSVDGGLTRLCCLWYDKSRDRLYIGERDGRRVIIINHLTDFTASQV